MAEAHASITSTNNVTGRSAAPNSEEEAGLADYQCVPPAIECYSCDVSVCNETVVAKQHAKELANLLLVVAETRREELRPGSHRLIAKRHSRLREPGREWNIECEHSR